MCRHQALRPPATHPLLEPMLERRSRTAVLDCSLRVDRVPWLYNRNEDAEQDRQSQIRTGDLTSPFPSSIRSFAAILGLILENCWHNF
jgi:hypothetical protein